MSNSFFSLALIPPVPRVCSVCACKHALKTCGACRVVMYCSGAHQTAHREKHKEACTAIEESRAAFNAAETELRATSFAFDQNAGRFGGDARTRGYMAARYKAADALLRVDTVAAIKMALEHFMDMLRLSRKDELHVRDVVPLLLMRLGREQESYDFIKWWSIAVSNNYDLDDLAKPYLDLKGANALEPIYDLDLDSLSLCQLATLALFKAKMYLDMDSAVKKEDKGDHDSPSMGSFARKRKRGEVARKAVDKSSPENGPKLSDSLLEDYVVLCDLVFERNSHLWELLARESKAQQPEPAQCLPGSESEAIKTVHHCRAAWREFDDERAMLDVITSELVEVYQSPAQAGLEIKRGTGRAFASLFESQMSPIRLFSRANSAYFVHPYISKRAMVFAGGACSDNGHENPRAGWAVVYSPLATAVGFASGRLETTGPFGGESTATSNRAELRAAIAALRLCDWTYPGFNCLVIATDSSYVTTGSTEWAKTWVTNGWKAQDGSDVTNRDLWELLLWEVERWDILGLRIEMWNIPRERNVAADKAAKDGCEQPAKASFTDAKFTQPLDATIKPRVLALCLRMRNPLEDSYLSFIAPKTELKTVGSEEVALLLLGQERPPPVLIAVDEAIYYKNKVLAERVIDHVRLGATLVLTGTCNSMVEPSAIRRFFAMMGLPGKYAGYRQEHASLNKSAVGPELADKLAAKYSMKALYLKDMPGSTMWYTADGNPGMSPMVMAPVGSGRVSFIGDLNAEEPTLTAFAAMCGLLG